MDDNPYRSPPATNEPAQPRPVRAAAWRGARIGAVFVFALYAILGVVVIIAFAAGVIPPDDLHMGAFLGGVVVWTLAGGVLGAALGALFQAIANAALRRAAGKRQTSD